MGLPHAKHTLSALSLSVLEEVAHIAKCSFQGRGDSAGKAFAWLAVGPGSIAVTTYSLPSTAGSEPQGTEPG